jgi:hypothetical protein
MNYFVGGIYVIIAEAKKSGRALTEIMRRLCKNDILCSIKDFSIMYIAHYQ